MGRGHTQIIVIKNNDFYNRTSMNYGNVAGATSSTARRQVSSTVAPTQSRTRTKTPRIPVQFPRPGRKSMSDTRAHEVTRLVNGDVRVKKISAG